MKTPHQIGEIVETGAQLRWECGECRKGAYIDPRRIARAKGWTFSLADQHPPCPTPDCLGRVTFYVGMGMRWQYMRTPDMEARSWRATCYPEEAVLKRHGWRVAAGLWRPPTKPHLVRATGDPGQQAGRRVDPLVETA